MIHPRRLYIQCIIVTVLLLTLAGTAYAAPTVILFNTTGTTTWTVPAGVTAVDYLVVAGGGGGGYYGGGGGAGGFRTGALAVVSGSVTVTVGSGGAGSVNTNMQGVNGTTSAFGSFTALGGGGGGSSNNENGLNGGSGGGTIAQNTIPGSGTPGQGNNGGLGDTPGKSGNYWAGGGGGAGSSGGNGVRGSIGGAGGTGTASSITGVSLTYAGGGGGGARSGSGGPGGTGGGGSGGVGANPGINGTPNTGGGGGGGGENMRGGSGGSGIVIIRYILPEVTNVTPASGPLEGGTNVTITGSGFTGVTAVRFGSTPAASYTFISDSTIFATSPPNATAGTVDVRVTTPYGTSVAVAGDKFTYLHQIQIDVNGTISNWALEIGENIDSTNLTLWVQSTGPWQVSVYDAPDPEKPDETAGYMAEYNGSSYISSGFSLSQPVRMMYGGGTSFINLSGIQQNFVSGPATSPEGTSVPLVVSQTIDYGDVSLTPPSFYQIIVTFVGNTL